MWTLSLVLVFGVVFSFLSSTARAQSSQSVTVTAPNGGECLIPGSQFTVTWTGEGYEHVALGFRTDDTSPPPWQQDNSAWSVHPVFGTSFKWEVPNITSSSVKLWIEAHNSVHAKLTSDSSNNTFTINDTCGVDEAPVPTAPTVNDVFVGETKFKPTDTIQVEKGKNVKLVGMAKANEVVTIYLKSTEKKFTVSADSSGEWSFEVFTNSLDEGDHQVDLETADSARAKALSFKVVAAGQTPQILTPLPAPAATTNSPQDREAIQRSPGAFPYIALIISIAAVLGVGSAIYLLARRRLKHVDQTPTEPPTIV